MGHQVPHQGLGDGRIDGIHTHVVAVIRRPAQRQLGKIAGADDQPAVLVCQVHQHLGPLPRLGVFIGDVVVLRVLADVPEMLQNRRADGRLSELRI